VEATIEVPDAPQTSRMGLCIAPHEPFTYYGFWLQRDADGDVGLINEMRKDLPVASEIRKPSLMRIIVWDDKLSVHANDTIYPRMKEAEYYVGPPGLTFGVGGRDNVSGLELKLKSIRLRKAKQEPPKEGR